MPFIIFLLLILKIPAWGSDLVIIDDFSKKHSHGHMVYEVAKHTNPKMEIITLDINDYLNHLKRLQKNPPLVLNLSFGGENYDQEEFLLLKQLSNLGTYIIVAAGNSNSNVNNLSPIYPCFFPIKNLICVGASKGNFKSMFSNFGPKINYFTNGFWKNKNMTSYAAPRFSAYLVEALKCQKDLSVFQNELILVNGTFRYKVSSAENYCYFPKSYKDPL